jgi:hypothetical protein
LAGLVLTRWHEAATAAEIRLPPPPSSTVADLLSICYQATLLREEGRPVTAWRSASLTRSQRASARLLAYRLCHAVRDALALVVSQDGDLRFIRWHDDGVTYWEQVATGLWEA